MRRRVQLGAVLDGDEVAFCVWAPRAKRVEVVFGAREERSLPLARNDDGYFSGTAQAAVGSLYRYRLDGVESYPDPCSRFQPQGPYGPSMLIDTQAFRWTDDGWRGPDPLRQVFYELHIGTFTRQGTYAAAADKLLYLQRLGITCIELMPVAEFVGDRGWGYDGVQLFAPYHCYGTPDDLRLFVDRAHALGIAVILDVVYNHVGGEGNCLPAFGDYFTERHSNEWGPTFNYYLEPVRLFAVENAAYWIREFHLDGLRLDAIQSIHDPQHPSLLAELVQTARAAAGERTILIAAEDYLQRAELMHREENAGGAGLDYAWNDDFHHSARVALTGNRGGYFGRYRGNAQEILSAITGGYLFQGQLDAWRHMPRGTPVRELDPHQFIAFIQNHDQVANTLNGRRIHTLTSGGRLRAITAALLLGPHTPLLFMGQEFNASSPFTYFADYRDEVAAALWAGRKQELSRFEQYAAPEAQAVIPDPSAVETYTCAKLDHDEAATKHAVGWQLHHDLIAIRQKDAVLARRPRAASAGAVLGFRAFLYRWYDEEHGDRLLVVNLGDEIARGSYAEPLLAPPRGAHWIPMWSSDDPCYGGLGVVAPETDAGWFIAGEAATLFRAGPDSV